MSLASEMLAACVQSSKEQSAKLCIVPDPTTAVTSNALTSIHLACFYFPPPSVAKEIALCLTLVVFYFNLDENTWRFEKHPGNGRFHRD